MKKYFVLTLSLSLLLSGVLVFVHNKGTVTLVGMKQVETSVSLGSNLPDTTPESTVSTAPAETITITIGGDVMLDRFIRQNAISKGYDFVFGKLKPYLSDSDFALIDLEGPVTTNKSISIHSKIGSRENYVFTFDPLALKAVKNAGVDLVSIGNNHILNQGPEGLTQTKSYLADLAIPFIGEPNKLTSYTAIIKGFKVGFINFNEFDNTSKDTDTFLTYIKTTKEGVDYLIVNPHWGVEYETYANAHYQELAHSFVDSGADAVIGSHPHVVQQTEIYKNKPIYYSLGNLVMDQYFEENVKKGLLLILTIDRKTLVTRIKEINTLLDYSAQTQVVN